MLAGIAGTPKEEVSAALRLAKKRRAARKANKGRQKKT
jgi:hypothetical protein